MTASFSKIVLLVLFAFASVGLNAQTQSIIESYVNKQGSTIDPPNYAYKCAMYDGRVFFVMPKGSIVHAADKGGFETIGERVAPPKGREEFQFMLTLTETQITYAVDKHGYIWQSSYPFREIVGLASKR